MSGYRGETNSVSAGGCVGILSAAVGEDLHRAAFHRPHTSS